MKNLFLDSDIHTKISRNEMIFHNRNFSTSLLLVNIVDIHIFKYRGAGSRFFRIARSNSNFINYKRYIDYNTLYDVKSITCKKTNKEFYITKPF